MDFGNPKTFLILAVIAVAGCAMLLAMLKSPRSAALTICGLIFFSSLAAQDAQGTDYSNNVWLRPLQVNRKEFYLAFGILTLLVSLIHMGRITFSRLPVQGVLLLVMNLLAGLLDMHHLTPLDGVQRVVFMTFTVGPLLVVVPSLLREWNDYLLLLRAIGAAGAVWAVAATFQLLIDRTQMVLPGTSRFTGLLGNPQGTATYLGPMCTILTWLFLNEPVRKLRPMWMACAGVMLLFLIWTGSRTGALMYMFGVSGVLYSRAGRAVLLVPIVGAAVYGAFALLVSMGVDVGYSVDRLLSGTDTRTEIWLVLLGDAASAPIFGLGYQRQGGVENSLLLGWVQYGPIMALLILLYMAISGVICLRLMAHRRRLPSAYRSVADLVIAFNMMYFAGSMFEWFIMARVDSTHVLMVVFGSMAGALLQAARTPGGLEYEDWSEDYRTMREDYVSGVGSA